MPQLLAAAIVAAFPTTAAVVAGVTIATWIASAVFLVGGLAYSQSQKRRAERAARAQYDSSQVDRQANVVTTVGPRELVLGRSRKGGTIAFRGSSNPFQSTFMQVIVLAGHQIDAVEQVYFNDVAIQLDSTGRVLTAPWGRIETSSATESVTWWTTTLAYQPIGADQVTVSRTPYQLGPDGTRTAEIMPFTLSGKTVTIDDWQPSLYEYSIAYQYSQTISYAGVNWHLGGAGQVADGELPLHFPNEWGAAQVGNGVAYLVVRFEYDDTAFTSGMPLVTAQIRGARCYDPRTGLTAFTENAAIMMRHVLTHPQFGKRTSISASEDARIIAAANACDTALSYTGADWVQMYRAAIVVPFGASARDALDDLAQAMAGQWAFAAGEFYVRAGVYTAPVLTLADADLAVVQRSIDGGTTQQPITISPHRPRSEKINSVVARIWDQAANYVETPITPFKVAGYITADGAELSQEVTMPAVFYAPQAYHIAGVMLRDARDPLTVTLCFKLRAYPIELFDVVALTLARYGWAAKEFLVLGRSLLPDGRVQLTLKETAAAITQPGAGFPLAGYADNTALPRPWEIYPPSILSLVSGESDLVVQSDGTVVNGVRVTWSTVSDASVLAGSIEIQYQVLPDATWFSKSVPGGDTSALLTGIADNATVVVRVRARSDLATSDWSPQKSTVANGKAAAPPDMQNLSISGDVLSWSLPYTPRDLAGFVFRFHYGNNLDWNSAAPLHTGVITQSPYKLTTRPSGAVTIMGRAIDTSGNVSAGLAVVVMNLGDPTIANIVESWNFDSLGWPYVAAESSGWTIVSGDPSANALDSFYGTDDQSFYGEGADSFYEPSSYAEMVYVTPEITITAALAGSVMTLTHTTQGDDVRIEYRLAGPGPFYGPNDEPAYGGDADPFYDGPGDWLPWPGQIVAARDIYQFRVTIGAGPVRGILQALTVVVDAPDLEESIADLPVSAAGTTIPYTKAFTAIKVITAQLQANGSGAITVEITKTPPLAPSIKAYNSSHTAVSGATADIVLKGY